MNVIRRIYLRELTEHLRSMRLVLLSSVGVGLMLLATVFGAHASAMRAGATRALEAEFADAMLTQAKRGRMPHLWGWTEGEIIRSPALRAIRHPSQLASIAMGQELSLPRFWQFSTIGVEEGPVGATASELAAGRVMDLSFIVTTVFGLLAIVIAYDSVAGEREQGTLKALLTCAVRRSDVLLGKVTAMSTALVLPLAAGFVVALVVLVSSRVDVLGEGAPVRVLLSLVAGSLYLVVVGLIGLLISTMVRRSSVALILSLSVWFAIAVVIPSAAPMIAGA